MPNHTLLLPVSFAYVRYCADKENEVLDKDSSFYVSFENNVNWDIPIKTGDEIYIPDTWPILEDGDQYVIVDAARRMLDRGDFEVYFKELHVHLLPKESHGFAIMVKALLSCGFHISMIEEAALKSILYKRIIKDYPAFDTEVKQYLGRTDRQKKE